MGIQKKDLGNLFKLFGKLKDENNLNQSGVGLGLTIVKQIVEKMNGYIDVQSIHNHGTTFKFEIQVGLFLKEG